MDLHLFIESNYFLTKKGIYLKVFTLKSIGIIVLNWQGWEDTLVCLESLRQLTYRGPISLIVCDNASTNDSFSHILNWAKQYYRSTQMAIFPQPPLELLTSFATTSIESYFEPQKAKVVPSLPSYSFILIQTAANRGFAGGNNVGIRYALLTQAYQYLWILNNDTKVAPEALAALYDCATAQPQIALWGSTILDYVQSDQVQCAGGCRYFPVLTMFKPVLGGYSWSVLKQQPPASVKLDYVAGAAMFLRVTAMERVGLLNEEYFLFYEELDYTQRLKRQGYQIGWCPQSLVYHKGSASVGNTTAGSREQLRRANYYENLSTLKYTANFHPKLLPLVIILRFILKSLVLLKRGDFYLFPPLWQAYRDFWQDSSPKRVLDSLI